MPQTYSHSRYLAQLLKDTFPDRVPLRGAEVGVYKGETSAHLLRELPALQLTLIDCWEPAPFKLGRNQFSAMAKQQNRPEVFAGWEREARGNVAFAADRVRIVKGDFRAGAAALERGSLDFVFLDAAHSWQDTMEQILAYAPKVRPGGLVTGHDYGFPRAGYEVVAQAVDAFAAYLNVSVCVHPDSYVWHWTAQ